MTNDASPLKVIIVGAGLGGLAAGCGLREFADVTILETTAFLGEIGAAVHLGPNAHRIIKKYGADLIADGAVPCVAFQEWRAKDDKLMIDLNFNPKEQVGIEWALCHRADLQQRLYDMATATDRPGLPCKVLFSTPVESCDPDAGTVTTKDGTVYTADVIVAADGIKSAVRPSVIGDAFSAKPSGHSAYRGLLKAEHINANPELKELGLLDGRLVIVNGGESRLVCYPTRNGEVLNYVAIIPDGGLNELSEEKWSARGDVQALCKSFSSFPKRWVDLLALTETCGLWQLRDQDPLDEWVRGRTIIIGDAAHAMLPHQGQGASQAIEDGEALAAFLKGVAPADIPAALQRVFNARYRRATYAQEISRASGLGAMRKQFVAKLGQPEEEMDGPLNPNKYQKFNWGYFGAEEWEKSHPEWVIQKE